VSKHENIKLLRLFISTVQTALQLGKEKSMVMIFGSSSRTQKLPKSSMEKSLLTLKKNKCQNQR
jgi:hypothetical protein